MRSLFQLAAQTPGAVDRLVANLADGFASVESLVASKCCGAADNLVRFCYEERHAQTPDGELVRQFLNRSAFQAMLGTAMLLIMSGEATHTWHISRPLLGLILLQPQAWAQLQQNLVQQQAPEKRAKLQEALATLMRGVKDDLTVRNCDEFTSSLFAFAQRVKQGDNLGKTGPQACIVAP